MDTEDYFGSEEDKERRGSTAVIPVEGEIDEGILNGERDLIVRIGEPEKHGEGTVDAYVSYEVNTTTRLSTFSAREMKVKRRFQDFVWLHDVLYKEFKTVFIPPVPEKNRTEYLDRFGTEFIEKRRVALQRFMDRITTHPVLKHSETLKVFLEAKNQLLETAKEVKKPQTDIGLMLNAFTKVRNPDQQFTSFAEHIQSLETTIANFERVVARTSKRQEDLCEDLTDLSGVLNMMEEEEIVGKLFHQLAQTTDRTTLLVKELNEKMNYNMLSQLRDYYLYCESIRSALKEREVKQATAEELSEYLKEKVAHANAPPEGAAKWLANIKISNLPESIPELEVIVNDNEEKSKQANEDLKREISLFSDMKVRDLKATFREFANGQAEFYESSLKTWEQLLVFAESIPDE